MNSHARRRQRRVDRQIRRPGLQHRQNRHDRLGRSLQQQCHTLHPGPHRGRPAGAPTGSRPHRARGRSTSWPSNISATASGARATCSANNTGIDTGVRGLGQHRPVADLIQAGMLSAHRADRSTKAAVSGRRSSPPTPAPTARSAPRCCPRRTHRCETPPPRQSRRAHRRRVKRSARENVKSMRAVRVSTGIGVTCRSPKASFAGSLAFCQANATWTSG